jgi:hypothetical protein
MWDFQTRKLITEGTTVQGTVIAYVVYHIHGRHARTEYRPKVRYRLPSGEQRVFVSSDSNSNPQYHPGEAVEVLYNPADPDSAEIKLEMTPRVECLARSVVGRPPYSATVAGRSKSFRAFAPCRGAGCGIL